MTDLAIALPPPARDRSAAAARGALALLGAALAYGLVRLGIRAAFALDYPYGLDYGEGTVWQQMRGIVAGEGYAPLGVLPAFVYEYPPLYHLAAACAGALGIDELSAGRLVSLLSAGGCAWLIAGLAGALCPEADRAERRVAGAMAGLLFAALPVVLTWSLLMRVDMLACALTLCGTLLAVRGRPVAAGLVFAAAVYTRQTCLPAPAAAFAVLLVARPREAWRMAAAASAAGLVALVALEIATRGQFLVHILLYNMNRIVWAHWPRVASVLLAGVVMLALGGIGGRIAARGITRARLRTEPDRAAAAIVLLTLALKALTLPAMLKVGASDNYLLDLFSYLAVLAGVAAVPVIRAARTGGEAPAAALLLLGAGVPVQVAGAALFPDPALARDRPALDALARRIAASPKPVVSDDMVLVLRGGKPVIWEPAIVSELGLAGLYDERALAKRVERGDFGFFVTAGVRGTAVFDGRFNPVVVASMERAYPLRTVAAGMVVRSPTR